MIYHPAVPLGDGSLVISTFYFFRKQNFIVKALKIAFFCIETVGVIREHQAASDFFVRVFFFHRADCSGAHFVEPSHFPVQEHCPAFGFYELFQCFFDLFTDIRLKNLPVSGKTQVTILFYSHFPSQNKKVSVYKLRESLNTFIILLALCEGQ